MHGVGPSRRDVRVRQWGTAIVLLTLGILFTGFISGPTGGPLSFWLGLRTTGGTGASTAMATRVIVTKTVVVRAGETLWHIARREVGREGDPRPLIEEIRRLNQLDRLTVYPGQQLLVPVVE